MNDLFSSLGLITKVVSFMGVLVPLLIVFLVFRSIRSFKTSALRRIGSDVFEKIDQLPKPNRSYIKTKCDHCGARCKGPTDISPSGDLKCSYCDSWFNVLRPG